MSPERQVDVQWNEDIRETYPVKILVRSYDRVGLLADLAANISKNEANILSVNTRTLENKIVDSHFTLAVEGTEHLEKVLTAIRKVRQVQEVRRIG
jgi:GTP pyrophosphokinase